jgi:hypothetical protein
MPCSPPTKNCWGRRHAHSPGAARLADPRGGWHRHVCGRAQPRPGGTGPRAVHLCARPGCPHPPPAALGGDLAESRGGRDLASLAAPPSTGLGAHPPPGPPQPGPAGIGPQCRHSCGDDPARSSPRLCARAAGQRRGRTLRGARAGAVRTVPGTPPAPGPPDGHCGALAPSVAHPARPASGGLARTPPKGSRADRSPPRCGQAGVARRGLRPLALPGSGRSDRQPRLAQAPPHRPSTRPTHQPCPTAGQGPPAPALREHGDPHQGARTPVACPTPAFDGQPNHGAELEAEARQTPGVQWLGALDGSRINGLLADHDVLVLPSIWPENSPLVVREASAAGLRLILPGTGGARELAPEAPAPSTDEQLLEALIAEVRLGRGRVSPRAWPTPAEHAAQLVKEVYRPLVG